MSKENPMIKDLCEYNDMGIYGNVEQIKWDTDQIIRIQMNKQRTGCCFFCHWFDMEDYCYAFPAIGKIHASPLDSCRFFHEKNIPFVECDTEEKCKEKNGND